MLLKSCKTFHILTFFSPKVTGIAVFLNTYGYIIDQFNYTNSLLRRPIAHISGYFTGDFSGTSMAEGRGNKGSREILEMFEIPQS